MAVLHLVGGNTVTEAPPPPPPPFPERRTTICSNNRILWYWNGSAVGVCERSYNVVLRRGQHQPHPGMHDTFSARARPLQLRRWRSHGQTNILFLTVRRRVVTLISSTFEGALLLARTPSWLGAPAAIARGTIATMLVAN